MGLVSREWLLMSRVFHTYALSFIQYCPHSTLYLSQITIAMSSIRSNGPQPVRRPLRAPTSVATSKGNIQSLIPTAIVTVFTIVDPLGPRTLIAQWPLTPDQFVRENFTANPHGISLHQRQPTEPTLNTCAYVPGTIVSIENIPQGYQRYEVTVGDAPNLTLEIGIRLRSADDDDMYPPTLW